MGISIGVPSAFFLLVYLRFSGFEPGDSVPASTPTLIPALAPGPAPEAGPTLTPVPVAVAVAVPAPTPLAALTESLGPVAGVFPAFGLFCGGGVTPPLASRLAASFCSLASSARSRLDIMPSFGGLPGPRRRAGCWASPSMEDGICCDGSFSLVFNRATFLSDASLPRFSVPSSFSISSISTWAFSSSSM